MSNLKRLRRPFAIVFGLMLAALMLWGQAETGQIIGTVQDASGAVVPNVTVAAKNVETGTQRGTTTNTSGVYVLPNLRPGDWEITISASGFATQKKRVTVDVGAKVALDAKMEVGQTSTTVEVNAGAVQVNTESQTLSNTISNQQVTELPSLTRNPYDFVATVPNVSGDMQSGRGVGYAIDGMRSSSTNVMLDGVANNDEFTATVGQQVPLDSVQEYAVTTSTFSAEYGRASGGVVNVTTKSGSNAFHGSLWEFNRLSAYTANTYGNVVNDIPKGGYTRNQFGFQVGGPIIKNKLFVSESTEWTRVRSSAAESLEELDPTFVAMLPANTQSYFSKYGTGAYPATGAVTTAGQLAAAGKTIGPINGVTAVAAGQPIFDTVNFNVPFNAGGGNPQNSYDLVGRLDYNLGDRTQMFFRMGREHQNFLLGTTFYSEYPQFDVGTANANQSYLYSLTHSFSNSIVNNTKISFTRFNSANSFDTAQTNTPNLMIVPGTDPVTGGAIRMPGLENYGQPGEGGLPYGGPQNTIQLGDDFSWTKGKHNMKFGGLYTYLQLNVAYGAYAQAVEQLGPTFQDSMNDLVNVANNPGGSQLSAFAARVNPNGVLPCPYDIYGNLVTTGYNCAVTPPLSSAAYGRSYRYNDWAIYAQDSFRLTSKLTLNYGLRLEHYGVQHNNKSNLDSNFYFGSGSSLEEQVRNGQVEIADKSSIGQFWKPRWGTLAPRIGFAFDPFGDGKSSIRGGYGISYERNFGNVTYNASFNPPASAVVSSNCSPQQVGVTPSCSALVTNNDLGPLGVPGPASNLGPVEIRMPNPNIQVASTQFWSLAIQRQIAKGTLIELGYSGAHGVHLYDVENINQVGAAQAYLGDPLVVSPLCDGPGGGYVNEATGATECLTRPNQQYAAINMRGSLGSSSYNALNLKFQSQDLHHSGVSLVANYTWSHTLDDISSTFSDSLQGGSGDLGSLGYTDPFHPKLDWGNADYDVRQRFVLSPIWETPWYKNGKGLGANLAGGWSFVGVFTARTGTPFSVYDYDNIEIGYTVPRLTPATQITQYKTSSPVNQGGNVFNTLTLPLPASSAPLNTALGISDLGPFPANMTHRNAFVGPGAWNFDLAMGKKFKVTERFGLEFRAEGFNIFNHHNFYVNTTTLAYPNPTPLVVTEEKGGLGSLATGGNTDERRFGQFSLRATF